VKGKGKSKIRGHSSHQTASKTQQHGQSHLQAHHQAKAKATKTTTRTHTKSQVQAAISEANHILQKHRNDGELLEVLGHVWNTASDKDRVEMLSLLSDRSVAPDASSLNFRYHYTENKHTPAKVMAEAATRRRAALAYSAVLSRFADVHQRSHIMEQTIWHSLSASTQAQVYDMFDLNDQAARTLSGAITYDCSNGGSVDAHQHCYPVPGSKGCTSPSHQFSGAPGAPLSQPICVVGCALPPPSTCTSSSETGTCLSEGYCQATEEAKVHVVVEHHSGASRIVFSLSAILVVLFAVLL